MTAKPVSIKSPEYKSTLQLHADLSVSLRNG